MTTFIKILRKNLVYLENPCKNLILFFGDVPSYFIHTLKVGHNGSPLWCNSSRRKLFAFTYDSASLIIISQTYYRKPIINVIPPKPLEETLTALENSTRKEKHVKNSPGETLTSSKVSIRLNGYARRMPNRSKNQSSQGFLLRKNTVP